MHMPRPPAKLPMTREELDNMNSLVTMDNRLYDRDGDPNHQVSAIVEAVTKDTAQKIEKTNLRDLNSVVIVTTNEKTEDITKYEDSLANRYLPCFIEFKPFNSEACIEMAKRNLKNPCGDFYKKQGISVSWDDSGLKLYADKLSKESTNGRTMSQLAKSWTVIVDRFLEDNPECKNIVLSYDNINDKVFAKEEN